MAATIEEARAYLKAQIFGPALASSGLPEKLKNTLATTWIRLQQFRKAGDLLIYLDRFRGDDPPETRDALHSLGLKAFEDLRIDFRSFLGAAALDVTTLSDFVIGERYTSWDILIFARVYDPRHGGIFLIPNDAPFDAIFVKATLQGGKYPNEWLEPGRRLKYYFYAKENKFDPNYKFNKAVLNAGKTPILVFVRVEDNQFFLEGNFSCVADHVETSGARWFELEKQDSTSQPFSITDQEYKTELAVKVARSEKDSTDARKARLATAKKTPRKIVIQATGYVRNPDVIAEVLTRAAGVCEHCKEPAPFNRKSDGTPYLEVHHVVQLANGGEDTVKNALALCPNCHRKRHFG